jgi:hypothetical protein|tara:strand:- start:2087 stop:2320 length:234 start_codon:yes stop_codon:yes gene_type:complete
MPPHDSDSESDTGNSGNGPTGNSGNGPTDNSGNGPTDISLNVPVIVNDLSNTSLQIDESSGALTKPLSCHLVIKQLK